MVKELRSSFVFLEHLVGKKMDWEKLEAITGDLNRDQFRCGTRSMIAEANPAQCISRDFWSLYEWLRSIRRETTKILLKLYQDMYEEVKQRVERKIGSVLRNKYRGCLRRTSRLADLNIFE